MSADHPPFPEPNSPERIELLFDLAAGLLDEATVERFTAELTESEYQEIEDQRSVNAMLATAPAVTMEDDERAALREMIRSEASSRTNLLGFKMPERRWSRSNWAGIGGVAASLLLVVVAGGFVLGGLGTAGDDAASSVAADAAATTTMQAEMMEESAASDEDRSLSAPATAAAESLQAIPEPEDGSGVAAVEDVSVIRESDVEDLLAETPPGPRPYNPENLLCRDEIDSEDVTFGYLGRWADESGDRLNAVMFKIERGLEASVQVLDTADCSLLFELDK